MAPISMTNGPGKVLLLLLIQLVAVKSQEPGVEVQFPLDGGLIEYDQTITTEHSPYIVRNDIIVAGSAVLTIDAGVEMRFSPGVGMVINGTLIARGRPNQHILLTREGIQGNVEWPKDIRLVEGEWGTVWKGNLNLHHQGKWRHVCTANRNWTQIDVNTTCHHLGFLTGNFTFEELARNDTVYMQYEQPNCTGSEANLFQCPGARNIKLGGRICENQEIVGIECIGLANNVATDFWKGIEFWNSTTIRHEITQRNIYNESASVMEYVDIRYAGMEYDDYFKRINKEGVRIRNPIASVRAAPRAPKMNHVTVKFSALDGMNLSSVVTSSQVDHSEVSENRGHGLVVRSRIGRVQVNGGSFHHNSGDGIRVKMMDEKYFLYGQYHEGFCRAASLRSQAYPVQITGVPDLSSPCVRRYETQRGHILSLVVLEMDRENREDIEGWLEVRDGEFSTARLLMRVKILNGTMPQGITTSTEYMWLQFRWKAKSHLNCVKLESCLKFTVRIESIPTSSTSGPYKGPEADAEIRINTTTAHNNTGHGIYVENVRNYVFVNHSVVSDNQYEAGLRVYGGAGDVHVNHSIFERNEESGVNITYTGGYRIFNHSTVSNNKGDGIYIRLNETMKVENRSRFEKIQRTEIFHCRIENNNGMGVMVGNYCLTPSIVHHRMPNEEVKIDEIGLTVINETDIHGNRLLGIDFESCWRSDSSNVNFTVGYSRFSNNGRLAIRGAPMLHVVGRIGNNTFRDHTVGVLLLNNGDDPVWRRIYQNMNVNYSLSSNIFERNSGRYVVNLQMTKESGQQVLEFKHNYLDGNTINLTFPGLNARSRSNAVAVVSSNNVIFQNNHMVNPSSLFEFSTHLVDHTLQVTVNKNWWGTTEYSQIAGRLFDYNHRYDLARLVYDPVLLTSNIYGDKYTDTFPKFEEEFQRPGTMIIGGRLGGQSWSGVIGGTYTVDKDIHIERDGAMNLKPGVTLLFPNSIGILVEGELMTRDSPNSPSLFTLGEEPETWINDTHVRIGRQWGSSEGLLEVYKDGQWGTVCNVGWNMANAALVCQMMGYTVHPDSWLPQQTQRGDPGQPIWLSNVYCDEMDSDIMQCRADQLEDHSCDHSMDVNVKCVPVTWAGVRITMAQVQRPSILRHLTIEKFGLLDPAVAKYAPGLQVDYNFHTLEHLKIRQGNSAGMQIFRNFPYGAHSVQHLNIENNIGSGLITRSPWIKVKFCNFIGNTRAGLEYDPSFKEQDAWQVRSWMKDPIYIERSTSSLYVPGINQNQGGFKYLFTRRTYEPDLYDYWVEVRTDTYPKFILSVELLDYNPDTHMENLTFYDSQRINYLTARKWEVERDLVDFPLLSSGPYITINWKTHGIVSGRLSMIIRSRPLHSRRVYPNLDVENSTMAGNNQGIVTKHYNSPSNEFYDLFIRYYWEEIRMYGLTIRDNVEDAMFIPSITKYHQYYMPDWRTEAAAPERLADIWYTLESCEIFRNGKGIHAEHNHVEFTNNAWHWEIMAVHVYNNREGGYIIELPKINSDQIDRYEFSNHTVNVNDSIFENNERFAFVVHGFYCNGTLYNNIFRNNVALKGIFTISGMEKDLEVEYNYFYDNTGKYVVQYDISSHNDYSVGWYWYNPYFMYNDLKRNKPFSNSNPDNIYSPESYTMAVIGVQNITVNRNLFGNSMAFEIVAGVSSSSLLNYLDVRENYWGTRDQMAIRNRLFDFDHWNSFAIAEYYPYLIDNKFDSLLSTGGKIEVELDINKPLGGRVKKSLTLTRKSVPYVVVADLTVMPGAILALEPGVKITFAPHVGILVLGTLVARGDFHRRIEFSPMEPGSGRMKRQSGAPTSLSHMIRLHGGERPNEGFVELFNKTTNRWNIVCDQNWNEKTAEVACRDLGFESQNVHIRRTKHYDAFVHGFYPTIFRKYFWESTFFCDGTETSLDQCNRKMNYHLAQCINDRQYVFMRCEERNLPQGYQYWGNIRFSSYHFEWYKEDDVEDCDKSGDCTKNDCSVLEYVTITGAGMLHGEKAAAVQTAYQTPESNHVTIQQSLWNGYDFIAPRCPYRVAHNHLNDNLGYAVGALVLNGETSDRRESSFFPLSMNNLPYNTYGLVRICTSERRIEVQNRVLLYYKYDFRPVDCVKVLKSKARNKRIAIRFLQLNVFNDTFDKNNIEIFNGEYFDNTELLASIDAGNQLKMGRMRFESSDVVETDRWGQRYVSEAISVHMHASAAHGNYGFIAEVTSLPQAVPGNNAEHRHVVYNTTITKNQRGGIHYMNVGEITPSMIVDNCRLQNNGLAMRNLSSEPVIYGFVQNSIGFTITNNYMSFNKGGVNIETTTVSAGSALSANISNNVMSFNTHGEVLHVIGHHYQRFNVYGNMFSHNDVEYRNLTAFFGVIVNATSNTFWNNTAGVIVNSSSIETVEDPHRFQYNSMYRNRALGPWFRTTVYCASSRARLHHNYLVNEMNFHELVTGNRTRQYCPDITKWEECEKNYPTVDASNNWWGHHLRVAVSGRIWERQDDDNLVRVQFEPFYSTNQSLLDGRCSPGWTLHKERCYKYFGGAVPWDDARLHCALEGSQIAWVKYREEYLTTFMKDSQSYYFYWRSAWVSRDDIWAGRCASLRNNRVENEFCHILQPFICEKDPYIASQMDWPLVGGLIGGFGFILIVVIILLALWCIKSKERKKQHLERANSLRSLRGSRQNINASKTTLNTVDLSKSEPYRRSRSRLYRSKDSLGTSMNSIDIIGATMDESSDVDTINKAKLDDAARQVSVEYLPKQNGSNPSDIYAPSTKVDSNSYYGSEYGSQAQFPYRLENEIANIMAKPMYDNVLQNRSYDERSIDRSHLQLEMSPPPTPMHQQSAPITEESPQYNEQPPQYTKQQTPPRPTKTRPPSDVPPPRPDRRPSADLIDSPYQNVSMDPQGHMVLQQGPPRPPKGGRYSSADSLNSTGEKPKPRETAM
ncbi:unnamed protein product [Owenia fusiformis]|uniref:Uncharacterized protein n=1 Tax=Owenia fusiformis TaxID=6347 RepID=A0A8J1U0V7_OWEFU|nr:unnamed protein product [Owenia fusiformis]